MQQACPCFFSKSESIRLSSLVSGFSHSDYKTVKNCARTVTSNYTTIKLCATLLPSHCLVQQSQHSPSRTSATQVFTDFLGLGLTKENTYHVQNNTVRVTSRVIAIFAIIQAPTSRAAPMAVRNPYYRLPKRRPKFEYRVLSSCSVLCRDQRRRDFMLR